MDSSDREFEEEIKTIESGGSDSHDPGDDGDYSETIICYAKFGIHRYNMIHEKNLELSFVENYNVHSRPIYSSYSMNLVAKDLASASGGSIVPFQTKILAEFYDVNERLSCRFAQPKFQPKEEEKPVNQESVEREVDFIFPEWPLEDAFHDQSRYCLVKKSDLLKYDWIRLYMKLAFFKANNKIKNPKLSRLAIVKVAVETDENVDERLKASNATFYIKYKYQNKSPRGRIGKPPPYRFAIVRRSMSKTTGLLKLVFDDCYTC